MMSEIEGNSGEEGSVPPTNVFSCAVLTYFCLGISCILPWNAFVSATDYFEYIYPNKHISRVFTLFLLFPSTITLSLLILFGHWIPARIRLNVGLFLTLLAVSVIPIVDSWLVSVEADRNNVIALTLTSGLVIIAGVSGSTVQGSITGAAGKLPENYMRAVTVGTAVCGLLIPSIRLATKAASSQDVEGLRVSARFYFIFASAFVGLCLILHNAVHKLPVTIHDKNTKNAVISGDFRAETFAEAQNGGTDTRTALLIRATNTSSGEHNYASEKATASSTTEENSLFGTLMALRWVMGSLILTCVISSSIQPGFLSEDVHSVFFNDYYPILLIAVFHAADMVGRLTTSLYIADQYSLTITATARLLFLPLFGIILHGPKAFRTEGPVFLSTALLGFTNGYVITNSFILAPKQVSLAQAERVGFITVLALLVAITSGCLVSWLWII